MYLLCEKFCKNAISKLAKPPYQPTKALHILPPAALGSTLNSICSQHYAMDAIWTNTLRHLDKYIWPFGQIHLAIWKNIAAHAVASPPAGELKDKTLSGQYLDQIQWNHNLIYASVLCNLKWAKQKYSLWKKFCDVSSFTKMGNFPCHGICIQSLEFNVGG